MSGIPNPLFVSDPVSTPVDEWARDTSSAIHTTATFVSQAPEYKPKPLYNEALDEPPMPGGYGRPETPVEFDEMMDTVQAAFGAARRSIVAAGETAAQYVPSAVREKVHAVIRTSCFPLDPFCMLMEALSYS